MSTPTIMPTYGRLPVTFVKGSGVWLEDRDGKRYLDAISGIGVNALGHAHPAVTEAVCQQAGTLIHTSNLYGIEKQQQLADALCRISGMDNVFFANSGAEANEAAIKIARLHGHQRNITTPTIVVMSHAFHGRTMATLTATGNRKVQAGFEPLVSGFVRAPFGDLEAIEQLAANNHEIVAVMLEPIQGEGGLHTLPEGYLQQLRALCDQHDWLLMLDEVQTGNGRTGRYFAFQHDEIIPDVVTTAKGLGNGLPIGACLAHGKAAALMQPGNHGSTYGGNPLCCAAACAVINTIEEQQLCQQAAERGDYIRQQIGTRLSNCAAIVDIRGRGLMIGIELDRPCAELVAQALQQGLLINVTAERIVRLLPPLITSQQEADQLLDILCPLIEAFCQ